ncbi:MAG: CDP-diacylglycerol--glycerol-3-phosphate 3-phosphatidyltransferase [Puniceicoccales bacterium]|jgi:CDP-diacylglycerol--glycerol-3-phosphate 3-phosphatidyltransferase|nr:CDP-diacylglycerol--glycerol-3-phosphate 3-phosphatidyltransferase [Puniceicoccales bacterium]
MKSLPNIMTLSRVPCLFVIAALVAYDAVWTATASWVVFTLAGISDYLDGWLARRMGIVSNFGKLMDALTDKIFNVGLMIFLLVYPVGAALLPNWCVFLVVVILVRELLVTGLRLVAASANIVLSAERSGKIKTVLQIFAVGSFLFVRAAEIDWGVPAGIVEWLRYIALGSFIGAALLTVTSGIGYLVKYWGLFMGDPENFSKKQ